MKGLKEWTVEVAQIQPTNKFFLNTDNKNPQNNLCNSNKLLIKLF